MTRIASRFWRALMVCIAVAALALGAATAAEAKVRVVTTTTDLADFVRNIGGNLVDVESIARGYQDPHHVDARPSYLMALRKANLFVELGRDMEVGWVPSLLQNCRNSSIQPGAPGFVDASISVPPYYDFGNAAVDRSMGDVHPLGNPHYWLDPANVKAMLRNIADGLKRVDPANAATYEANLAAYVKQLSATSRRWSELAKQIRGAKVVTYHMSWPYFAKRFGLQVVGTVEPKPGIAPSGAHISQLVKTMKAQGVRLIIMEPYFNPSIAENVARQAGAKVIVVAPSTGGEEGVNSYLDLITHQLEKIASALKG